MMKATFLTRAIAAAVLATGLSSQALAKEHDQHVGPVTRVIDLPVTTQGPLWPPAEVVDDRGHFVLIGTSLESDREGKVVPVPQQALLVSKHTVPPLDDAGVEAPALGGAPYNVIRPLDLSAGSADLDLVLHANSYGPANGPGGRPSIPRQGETAYNLNGAGVVCRDVFPAESQADAYTRPSLPLQNVPIYGFTGDGKRHDVDSGDALAQLEPVVDERRDTAITLGDWLSADGQLKVQLTGRNADGHYTGASFDFRLSNLIPNGLYTVWAVRGRGPDALAMPNVITTDAQGSAQANFQVSNPFPEGKDTLRIRGIAIVYHSDHQTWGGCFSRFGPGVDAHGVFNTLKASGPNPFADFVTVAQ